MVCQGKWLAPWESGAPGQQVAWVCACSFSEEASWNTEPGKGEDCRGRLRREGKAGLRWGSGWAECDEQVVGRPAAGRGRRGRAWVKTGDQTEHGEFGKCLVHARQDVGRKQCLGESWTFHLAGFTSRRRETSIFWGDGVMIRGFHQGGSEDPMRPGIWRLWQEWGQWLSLEGVGDGAGETWPGVQERE